MNKKKIFISTVKIAVIAEDENEACDAMSAILTENQQNVDGNHNSPLYDWQYLYEGTEYSRPKEVCEKPKYFIEGKVFDKFDEKQDITDKIRFIVAEWGIFNIAEVEGEGSPVLKTMGKDCSQCIDFVGFGSVETTIYVHDIGTDNQTIIFEDLELDVLNEVLRIAKKYAADQKKMTKE